eukprot:scaffold16951_cov48-Attheya_sp.AAC.9
MCPDMVASSSYPLPTNIAPSRFPAHPHHWVHDLWDGWMRYTKSIPVATNSPITADSDRLAKYRINRTDPHGSL